MDTARDTVPCRLARARRAAPWQCRLARERLAADAGGPRACFALVPSIGVRRARSGHVSVEHLRATIYFASGTVFHSFEHASRGAMLCAPRVRISPGQRDVAATDCSTLPVLDPVEIDRGPAPAIGIARNSLLAPLLSGGRRPRYVPAAGVEVEHLADKRDGQPSPVTVERAVHFPSPGRCSARAASTTCSSMVVRFDHTKVGLPVHVSARSHAEHGATPYTRHLSRLVNTASLRPFAVDSGGGRRLAGDRRSAPVASCNTPTPSSPQVAASGSGGHHRINSRPARSRRCHPRSSLQRDTARATADAGRENW